MRVLSILCTVLISMCVIMQHQSVEAKPFIFKFFLPQAPAPAPAPARDTSSSSSVSTGFQFPDILSTKLSLLTSLLQSKGSVSGGFGFGLKTIYPATTINTTTRPNTSTTNTTPDGIFEPESSTQSSSNGYSKTSTTTTTTTEDSSFDISTEKSEFGSSSSTEKNGYDYSTTSKVNTDNGSYDYSTSKVTTDKNGNDHSTSQVTTDNTGYDYSTSKVTTYKPDGYKYTTTRPGYNYQLPDTSLTENEISNEVLMISNQYLPAL